MLYYRCINCSCGGSEKSRLKEKEKGRVWLVSCSSSILLDHSWNHFPQVSDVAGEFLNGDCVPEPVDSSNKRLFTCRFDLPPQIFLELMPEVLNWVEVRALRGCLPPVDVVILEELPGTSGCMFGIVVLHEAVVVWVDFMQEGNKCFL